MSDLKSDDKTFDQAFQFFLNDSNKMTKDIIENIQYYYECYDGAVRRREEENDGVERTLDYKLDACPEDLTCDTLIFQHDSEPTDITEDDVETAYECRIAMREWLYAEVAMNTAIDKGIFSNIMAPTTHLPIAKKADVEQLTVFQMWGDQLKAVTRKQAKEGGPGLFVNLDKAAPSSIRKNSGWVEGVEVRITNDHHISQTGLGRPKRDLLKVDQRRAHDIIEDQLKKRLAGDVIIHELPKTGSYHTHR